MELRPGVPDRDPAAAGEAVALAGARLRDARAALMRTTGGAPARAVLAELAQQMAAELAAHFDDLPMHRFTGRVARAPGVLGAVAPGRRVPHRVVLGRYLSSTLPARSSGGALWSLAGIAVLGLGADGVLRVGRLNEAVHLPEGADPFEGALSWDDPRMRRVPSRALRVARWNGGGEAGQVADPARVLDALATLGGSAASASLRELELLRRLLGAGDTG
jgi:hypothetical protein